MIGRAFLTVAGLAVALLVTDATQGADAPPLASPPIRDYANACATCHDNGGFGVRVLADRAGQDRALIHQRNTLSPQVIRAVVRNGMGAMPAMSKIEVSDAELDGIIAELMRANTRLQRPPR